MRWRVCASEDGPGDASDNESGDVAAVGLGLGDEAEEKEDSGEAYQAGDGDAGPARGGRGQRMGRGGP